MLAGDAAEACAPLRDSVAAIFPVIKRIREERVLFNVNTPEDLATAEELLGR